MTSNDLIPAGYYTARAVRVQDDLGASVWARFARASTGTAQVVMVFEVVEGDWAGRRLTWFGFFTDNSWARTVESLRYCGFQGDDLETVNRQDLGHQVSICVEHQTTDAGKTYARVAWVNESGGVKLADPMTGDQVRMFAAQFRSRIAGLGGSARPATSRSGGYDSGPPHPAEGDPEIPF